MYSHRAFKLKWRRLVANQFFLGIIPDVQRTLLPRMTTQPIYSTTLGFIPLVCRRVFDISDVLPIIAGKPGFVKEEIEKFEIILSCEHIREL